LLNTNKSSFSLKLFVLSSVLVGFEAGCKDVTLVFLRGILGDKWTGDVDFLVVFKLVEIVNAGVVVVFEVLESILEEVFMVVGVFAAEGILVIGDDVLVCEGVFITGDDVLVSEDVFMTGDDVLVSEDVFMTGDDVLVSEDVFMTGDDVLVSEDVLAIWWCLGKWWCFSIWWCLCE